MQAWLEALGGDPDPASRDQLEDWGRRLDDPDLVGAVALFGRQMGNQGIRASRIMALFDGLAAVAPLETARRLRDAALDAHGLGLADRWHRRQEKERIRGTPVVQLGPDGVAVFLGGPISPEILDAALGRVLRFAVGRRARWAALELSHAEVDRALLVASLADLPRLDLPSSLKVVLCGLDSGSELAEETLRRSPEAPVTVSTLSALLPRNGPLHD